MKKNSVKFKWTPHLLCKQNQVKSLQEFSNWKLPKRTRPAGTVMELCICLKVGMAASPYGVQAFTAYAAIIINYANN